MDDFSTILRKDTVLLDIEPFQDKDVMFHALADKYQALGIVEDADTYVMGLYEREKQGSTFMGNGIALPHAKCSTVTQPAVMFCRLNKPFMYQSCGEEGMVRYIFMLAIAETQSGNDYIRMLATLAGLLANEIFLKVIATATSYQEIIDSAHRLYLEESEASI